LRGVSARQLALELVISKLAWTALQPVGLVLLLLCLAALRIAFNPGRRGLLPVLVAALLLWSTSTYYVAHQLAAAMEAPYPAKAVADYPTADVIVVLGGGVEDAVPPRTDVELREASDRVRLAARLYQAGKAPSVLVSGGTVPWYHSGGVEAAAMSKLLQDWGVPASAILREPGSRTTGENAAFTRGLLKERGFTRALLVTSGWHMRRALAIFESPDMTLIPASADIHGVQVEAYNGMDFLPRMDALMLSSAVLKEHVGLAYYRWRQRDR
jgi:uncharacterized SAM-binding protein YcdF (DUF218 family)